MSAGEFWNAVLFFAVLPVGSAPPRQVRGARRARMPPELISVPVFPRTVFHATSESAAPSSMITPAARQRQAGLIRRLAQASLLNVT